MGDVLNILPRVQKLAGSTARVAELLDTWNHKVQDRKSQKEAQELDAASGTPLRFKHQCTLRGVCIFVGEFKDGEHASFDKVTVRAPAPVGKPR